MAKFRKIIISPQEEMQASSQILARNRTAKSEQVRSADERRTSPEQYCKRKLVRN
ncbi:MAG: hypothetical protein ABH864_04900 [archaeon]